MAEVEVVLIRSVPSLGNVGDVVNVKGGYYRNYLAPKCLALRNTKSNFAEFERRKNQLFTEHEERLGEARQSSERVDGMFVTVIRRSMDDGRLFGSVASKDIAASIAQYSPGVVSSHVKCDLIKKTGVYKAVAAFYADVSASVYVVVASSQEDAKEMISACAKEHNIGEDL